MTDKTIDRTLQQTFSYKTVEDRWGNKEDVLTGKTFGSKENYTVKTPPISIDIGFDLNTDSPFGLHLFGNYSKSENLSGTILGAGG